MYGGAALIGIPLALGHALTRAPRSGVSAAPASGYEAVEVRSGELGLRAWVHRGEPRKAAVVVVHGLGDTLESYQQHARPLIDRGHSVLLLDLRGHGGSEGSRTTLGGKESDDVRAAMTYLHDADLADGGLVLMGHSMGAVAVLRAAADRKDVRAVVAEAPYDSYRATIAHHAWLLYRLPPWVPLIPLSIYAAELIAKFDADEIDCLPAAARIEAPLLAIVDGDDPRMPERVVRRIVDAHPGPKRMWIAAGAGHVGAILHPDWKKEVLGFLDENGI